MLHALYSSVALLSRRRCLSRSVGHGVMLPTVLLFATVLIGAVTYCRGLARDNGGSFMTNGCGQYAGHVASVRVDGDPFGAPHRGGH